MRTRESEAPNVQDRSSSLHKQVKEGMLGASGERVPALVEFIEEHEPRLPAFAINLQSIAEVAPYQKQVSGRIAVRPEIRQQDPHPAQ